MRELIDCHSHTARCGHATGTVAEYVLAARVAGLSALIMTEHLPLPPGLDPAGCYAMPRDDIRDYAREIAAASESAGDVLVIAGAESDWIPSRAAETREIRREARAAGIRVVLGSVHFLGEWAFDDPDLISEWDTRDIAQVWEAYFSRWCDAARSGEFDVMAHPDLVKKFGHRPAGSAADLYDAAAAAAAESGVLIEVSTAGLRKPVAELYPGPELLSAFRRHNVDATVGSDAHTPLEVGRDIESAYGALAEAGYDHATLPLGDGETRRIEL